MKLKTSYGPIDDLDMGPNILKISLIFKSVTWSLLLMLWGIEIWRARRGELFYRYWGFHIGTKKERT